MTVAAQSQDDWQELVGAAEACEILGVRSSNLRKIAGLPEPVQTLRSGPLWIAADIRALAERRKGS